MRGRKAAVSMTTVDFWYSDRKGWGTMGTIAAVTVGILFVVSMLFCIGMCRAASDADDRMEEMFQRKDKKEE